MRPIDRIVVHHSASPRETTVEQLTEWHLARGFDALGYHLVIVGSGAVRAGRDLWVKGAHAKGYNAHSVGVCVTGDNTKEEHRWNAAQIAALRAVLRTLVASFPGAVVCGHRDVGQTECPGIDIRELLAREG